MAAISWIKITTNIFDDEKILLIESLPEADAIIVIWFKLLTLAGKCNNDGVLMLNDKIPYTEEMLSTIFRRPLNTVRLALSTFEKYGMIVTLHNVITIPNWEKHQQIETFDKIKEQNKARQKAYRERQKMLLEENSKKKADITLPVTENNVTVTQENKNKIENKNKNLKGKAAEIKKNPKAELFDRIDDYTNNNELRDILKQYLQFKLKNCKGFTLEQWDIQLDLLNQFSNGDINRAIEKVKFAFSSNYQSLVYPDELNKKNNQQQNISNWYDPKNVGKAESDRISEDFSPSDIPF